MRKAYHLFFAFLVFWCANSYGQNVQVKNTETFISYFTSIKEIKNYFVLKDTLETIGARVKKSAAITPDNKNILKGLYDITQQQSEDLYKMIVADLMNKDKRQLIMQRPDAYVETIKANLDNIKNSGTAFINQYKQVTGDARAFALLFILFKFLLPVVKEFVTETLDNLVRQKLDKYLKPQIVIKPWTDL